MGTFEQMEVGTCFMSPARSLDDETVRTLIESSGFTHPMFTDVAYAKASGFGRIPVPGQAVLAIMGGLVEQTGRFDETVIALTGFDQVQFLKPAFAGDTIRVEVEVVEKDPTPSGTHGILVMSWQCVRTGGDKIAEATARMLFTRSERP
jgi:acyl dehydratase